MFKNLNCLNKIDVTIWLVSVAVITISSILGQNFYLPSLITSLIGVSSLIYLAKGHPFGQFLIIVFSLFYGAISFGFAYYGEVLTYIGMTAPMALLSLIQWLKNPYSDNSSEVAVADITKKKIVALVVLAIVVTTAFYFILDYFNTANLLLSTLSILTSFVAASLTFLRSEYYAVAYGLNDLVLIALWTLATIENSSYLTMIICFIMFFINDIYGFICWKKMKIKQQKAT